MDKYTRSHGTGCLVPLVGRVTVPVVHRSGVVLSLQGGPN